MANKKLEELFELYSANLGYHFPEFKGQFGCPICFRVFGKDALKSEHITLEHIIPKSLGGKYLTLTCSDCNTLGGTILDSHLARRLTMEDRLAGKDDSPLRGQLVVGADKINVDVFLSNRKDPNIRIIGLPKLNNPINTDSVRNSIESGAQTFEIKGSLGYRDSSSRVAILKIAYLLMFSYFGYGYIKYDVVEPVRRQIINSSLDTNILQGIIKLNSPPHEKASVTILKSPDNLRCFLVTLNLSTKLNRYIGVVLPGLDMESATIYDRWSTIDFEKLKNTLGQVSILPYSQAYLMDKTAVNFAVQAWGSIQQS